MYIASYGLNICTSMCVCIESVCIHTATAEGGIPLVTGASVPQISKIRTRTRWMFDRSGKEEEIKSKEKKKRISFPLILLHPATAAGAKIFREEAECPWEVIVAAC